MDFNIHYEYCGNSLHLRFLYFSTLSFSVYFYQESTLDGLLSSLEKSISPVVGPRFAHILRGHQYSALMLRSLRGRTFVLESQLQKVFFLSLKKGIMKV